MTADLHHYIGDTFSRNPYKDMLDRLSTEDDSLNVVPGSGYIRDTGLTRTWAVTHPNHPRVLVALVNDKYIVCVKAGTGVFIKPHELPHEVETYRQLHDYLSGFL